MQDARGRRVPVMAGGSALMRLTTQEHRNLVNTSQESRVSHEVLHLAERGCTHLWVANEGYAPHEAAAKWYSVLRAVLDAIRERNHSPPPHVAQEDIGDPRHAGYRRGLRVGAIPPQRPF